MREKPFKSVVELKKYINSSNCLIDDEMPVRVKNNQALQTHTINLSSSAWFQVSGFSFGSGGTFLLTTAHWNKNLLGKVVSFYILLFSKIETSKDKICLKISS